MRLRRLPAPSQSVQACLGDLDVPANTGAAPMRRGLPSLAELGSGPEEIAKELGAALASLVCRARHGARPGSSCAECLPLGRDLAAPVGRALFAVRRGGEWPLHG